MLRAGVTAAELAGCAGVDTKTVERWITNGRTPHRQHRWATARRLSVDETYLWPDVLIRSPGRRQEAGGSELVSLHPDRASVPRELWLRLLGEVQESLDVLVFSGTFYAQTQPRIARLLTDAAEYDKWELDRLRLYPDGRRKVVLRRKIIRVRSTL